MIPSISFPRACFNYLQRKVTPQLLMKTHNLALAVLVGYSYVYNQESSSKEGIWNMGCCLLQASISQNSHRYLRGMALIIQGIQIERIRLKINTDNGSFSNILHLASHTASAQFNAATFLEDQP